MRHLHAVFKQFIRGFIFKYYEYINHIKTLKLNNQFQYTNFPLGDDHTCKNVRIRASGSWNGPLLITAEHKGPLQSPSGFVVCFILIALRNSISFGDKMLFIPPPGSKANND